MARKLDSRGLSSGSGSTFSTELSVSPTTITSNTVISASSPYTLFYVDTTSGAVTITLPDPSLLPSGHFYIIADKGQFSSVNEITIQGAAGTIDGQANINIKTNGETRWLAKDGNNYKLI